MALDNKDLQALSQLLDEKLDAKLQPIENRLDNLENRFDKLENRVGDVENGINTLNIKVSNMESGMEALKDRVTSIGTVLISLNTRMERVETRMGNLETRMENLETEIIFFNVRMENLETDVKSTKERTTKIAVLLENETIPRLNTIESCYLSTYEKYAERLELLDDLESDMDNVKKTVIRHSEMLQKLA